VSAQPSAVASAHIRRALPPKQRIQCGSDDCDARSEVCCDGPKPHCLALVDVPTPATPQEGPPLNTDLIWQACERARFKRCDDAGDCADGETCCNEVEGGEYPIEYTRCVPLRAGRVMCTYAEECSEDDTRCARNANLCTATKGSAGQCVTRPSAHHKPTCPTTPCPDGSTCVAKDGKRSCEPGEHYFFEDRSVVECNGGRDCGEGESCFSFQFSPGRHCYWNVEVDPQSEPALCSDAADCTSFCRNTEGVARCHVDKENPDGRCECFSNCTKDDDCSNCMFIGIMRGSPEALEGFCDKKTKACDCRVAKKRSP
jgi:hypothetical protein